MPTLTADLLRRLAPAAKPEIVAGIAAHQGVLPRYGIDTPLRLAHFLAQACHESDGLRAVREYASGAAYEGRDDLGNTRPGDGTRFAGRGLLMLTGRWNYTAAGTALGLPLVEYPERVEAFPAALETAAWYWRQRGLNRLADLDDIDGITRRINGGLNGLADRKRYLARAKALIMGDGDNMPTREDIAAVQRALNLHGFGLAEDGFYGPKTAAAIRAFQRAHRLKVDGIAGPETLAALGVAAKPAAPVETAEPGKSLLRSRTFWGVIVSAVGKAAAVAGYDLGFDEDAAVSLILLCVSFVGDAIALWGRIRATTTVKARP